MDEIALVKNKRGKWSEASIPHKGWVCVDVEDSMDLSSTCEMCESQRIRFIHYMEHEDYPHTLAVGCICAGYMEEDLIAARKRDDFMKSRMAKKKRWLSRKWKISRKGNEYVKTDGYIISIFQKNNIWKACVSKQDDESFTKFSKRGFKTADKAKISSFDFITKLLNENNKNI